MDEVNKNMDSSGQIIKDDEIDLIEIIKIIWEGRKTALKFALYFCIAGLIYALGTKNEFEASCKLLAESNDRTSNLNGFGGLAGLAGINLDPNSNNSLNPELYPEVAHSVPFLLQVVNEPIYFKMSDTTVSSYQYFKEISRPSFTSYVLKYTIGLPSLIKSMIFQKESDEHTSSVNQNRLIYLSKEDYKFLKNFKKRIIVDVDINTGIITVNCQMPDSYASAELTDKCVNILTDYIEEYKISKHQENLNFIKERYAEAREIYFKSQNKLALFTDRNRNVITSKANIEYQILQNELNLAFDVYKGLANQLEQAKIRVKENTPVFTVLEPIRVPVEKSSPRRSLILIVSVFIGVFVGICVFFSKRLWVILKNR